LIQDRVAAFTNAREQLAARCHVVAERLAEGWKPWSPADVDTLVRVGQAIAVLDGLIAKEPTIASPGIAISPECDRPQARNLVNA
jgi:hypothetical protein